MNWRNCFDEMPKNGQRVLATDMNHKYPEIDFLVYFGDDDWSSYDCNTFIPTHGMPLPKLPETKEWKNLTEKEFMKEMKDLMDNK